MLTDSEIEKLLLDYKAGKTSEADRLKLELWADESEANRELLGLLGGDSPLAEELKTLYSYDQQQVWKNIRRETARIQRKRVLRNILHTVSAAALLIGILWGTDAVYRHYEQRDALVTVIEPGHTTAILELSSGMRVALNSTEQCITEADNTEIRAGATMTRFSQKEKQRKSTEPLFNKVIVPRGGEYQLELCDGTKIWLNAESEIIFPTRFDGDTRTVELKGEAYFEVKSDPAHPFIVKTDLMSVRVLGTSFNIMTYNDDPVVETTLITGSLMVVKDETETLIRPGMQARINRESNTCTLRSVYAESYAAWAKQMFVFFNEPIESICRKLARWYNVQIDASSESLRGIRYSGMIERAETFNKIADLLSATDELIFRERDGKITVEMKRP